MRDIEALQATRSKFGELGYIHEVSIEEDTNHGNRFIVGWAGGPGYNCFWYGETWQGAVDYMLLTPEPDYVTECRMKCYPKTVTSSLAILIGVQ